MVSCSVLQRRKLYFFLRLPIKVIYCQENVSVNNSKANIFHAEIMLNVWFKKYGYLLLAYTVETATDIKANKVNHVQVGYKISQLFFEEILDK